MMGEVNPFFEPTETQNIRDYIGAFVFYASAAIRSYQANSSNDLAALSGAVRV